jgi:macrolide-specific efflux system membrane fusion protein
MLALSASPALAQTPGATEASQQTVDAIGKLQFHRYAEVNAQVAGQIKDVLFAVGDTVRKANW